MANELFGKDEAEAILKRAAMRQAGVDSGVTREQLLAMAAELDIAPEAVEAVIAESMSERQESTLRKAFIAERRSTLVHHIVPYVSVNLFLFVINMMFSHDVIWFVFPLMGWGIGLASHIAASYPTGGSAFETAFAQYKRKNAAYQTPNSLQVLTARSERRAARAEELAGRSAASLSDVPDTNATPTTFVFDSRSNTEDANNVLRIRR